MAGTEVFAIVGVIVAAALIIPILLDDNPSAFLENSLCIIFAGGSNFTCNSIGGNVTFTGLNGIDIFPNGTNELIWNFTGSAGNGTGGGGNQTDETHTALGGDADIFRDETAFNANFRGISEGIGINVTEQTNDVLIALQDCDDNELLVYNGSTSDYECISGQDFSSGVAIDNDEMFFPHLSASGGDDIIVTFSDYDTRTVRFRDNKDTDATWKYVVPSNYNSTDMTFEIYWFSQDVASGSVCWELLTMVKNEGDDLDDSFTPGDSLCTPTTGVDILVIDEFTITSANHGFVADDLALIQISRNASSFAPDTHEDNVYLLFGQLKWN